MRLSNFIYSFTVTILHFDTKWLQSHEVGIKNKHMHVILHGNEIETWSEWLIDCLFECKFLARFIPIVFLVFFNHTM